MCVFLKFLSAILTIFNQRDDYVLQPIAIYSKDEQNY